MQSMGLNILSGRLFEETFENSQWRKANEKKAVKLQRWTYAP